MAVYKDGNKWRVVFRYTNWKGERKQTSKRGFETKKEAVAWEREELLKLNVKMDMSFERFFQLYEQDKTKRVKKSTLASKKVIIENKILPYFKNKRMDEIEPKDIIACQNELLAFRYPSENRETRGVWKGNASSKSKACEYGKDTV